MTSSIGKSHRGVLTPACWFLRSRRNPTSTDSTAPTQQSSVDDALKLFEPKPKTKIAPLKTDVHARVSEIIRGILLIQVPDETAYYLNLEWRDAGGLDQYPLEEIHAYMELFPDSNVSALLESACRYFGWQLPDEEQREKARKRRRRKESKGRGADDEDDLAADGPNEDQLPDPFNVLIVSDFHTVCREKVLMAPLWRRAL